MTITGSQYWGSDNITFTEYQFAVTLPQSSTTYVKLSIDSDGGDELGIDDFSIQGSVSCIPVTVTAFDATVQLSGSPVGVTVDATTMSATSAGDCFTVSSFEVSKTEGGSYASSVTYDCSETGDQTLYVRATDGSNVSAAISTTVTIQDATAPVAVAQDLTVNLDANGAATITASDIDNGSSDNCSVASLSLDITSFDCDDVGSPVTVTLTATDPSGNTDTATATVTVQDVTGPTIATPSGTYYFDSLGERLIWFGTTIGSNAGYSDACTARWRFHKAGVQDGGRLGHGHQSGDL